MATDDERRVVTLENEISQERRRVATLSGVTRRSRVIETGRFENVMAEALVAYRRDPSYAVAMTKQASTIQNKRDVWALRTELRQAEERATELCSKSAVATLCTVAAPCGTGKCPFAQGDLATIDVAAAPGTSQRPKNHIEHASQSYSIESAVRPLMVVRQA